ncbi:MAG: metallophosphoesterase family protein [candidate division NC10 bacterium]
MHIGLMADSHDHLPRTEQAVDLFNRHQVAFVIHAGDFVAPFALAPLERLQCDWVGVFGQRSGRSAISYSSTPERLMGGYTAGPLWRCWIFRPSRWS